MKKNDNFKFTIPSINPKSYFMKNYIAYTILILGSFILTATIFISQISIYSLEDKKQSLDFTVNRAKEQTEILISSHFNNNDTLSKLYSVNMMQIAEEANSTLLVSDLDGNIEFYYDSNNPHIQKTAINKFIITQTLYNGSYSEVGDLSGYFNEMSYIHSTVVYDAKNNPSSIILISMPATSIVDLIFDLSKIFFIVLIIVLVLILVFSYFITSKITYPLKTISNQVYLSMHASRMYKCVCVCMRLRM